MKEDIKQYGSQESFEQKAFIILSRFMIKNTTNFDINYVGSDQSVICRKLFKINFQ